MSFKERPIYRHSYNKKETGREEKASTYEIVTQKIIERMEQGDIPWKKPWKAQLPRNLITNKPYRGVNLLLLGSQDYQSPYWLTFKQAQEKGGHVRKGEKGSMVTFWKILEKDLEEEDKEGKELQFLLRYYTVFNLAQCEGIKAPPPEKVVDPIQKCEEIVGGYKDPPAVRYNNADKACYAPMGDYVSIQPKETFRSAEDYYACFFHELAHSTGHEKRLGRFQSRDVPRPLVGDEYSKEELVAELVSAFLCAEAGIDNSQIENSAAYIQGWLKPLRNDKRLIVIASSQAAKAVRYIMGQTEEE